MKDFYSLRTGLCFLMFTITEGRITTGSGGKIAPRCPAMLPDTLPQVLLSEGPPLSCSAT